MAPDIKQTIIGIREGEKIHEIMVTRDDSRNTYDYGDHYIIYPDFEWVNFGKIFKGGGIKLKMDSKYDSGSNSEWLSVDDIRELLKQYGLFEG
jgi:FlaA1/EpsC-like NDP-sugar epimerase